MEKINCNVIQDILPLYIDHAVCDDTKRLVEEHLTECESCRKSYNEILDDLVTPIDAEMKQDSAEEIRRFKKFFSKKRRKTVFLSVTGAVVLFVGIVVFMNCYMRRIEYREADFTYITEDAGEVYFKEAVKGNYRWTNQLDRDSGIMTIYYEQSLWDRYIGWRFHPFDHVVTFIKKDMIKAVYIEPDGTETTIWEASDQEKENYFRQERGPLG